MSDPISTGARRGRLSHDTMAGRKGTARGEFVSWIEGKTPHPWHEHVHSLDDPAIASKLAFLHKKYGHKSKTHNQPLYQAINKNYWAAWCDEAGWLLWQDWDPATQPKPRATRHFRLTTAAEKEMLREKNRLWERYRRETPDERAKRLRVATTRDGRVIRLPRPCFMRLSAAMEFAPKRVQQIVENWANGLREILEEVYGPEK